MSLSHYDKRSIKWTDEEIKEAIRQYSSHQTVNDIAYYFRKTPGQILYLLKKEKLITSDEFLRQLVIYQESSLYREIVQQNVDDRERKKEKKVTPPKEQAKSKEDNPPRQRMKDDIKHLREEMETIKKDVKEILRLMNALYDFESQPH
jgi:hypothetical protein